MNDSDMLLESLRRMLEGVAVPARTVAAEADGIDRAIWQELVAFGLVGPDLHELPLADQMGIALALGRASALTPFVDSELVARWLAAGTGIPTIPNEILTVAVINEPVEGDVPLRGLRFPYGRHAARALLSFRRGGDAMVVVVPVSALKLAPAANLAGEPSDKAGIATLKIDAMDVVPAGETFSPDAVMRRGAIVRVAGMVGAAERVEELSLRYAAERSQFGKALGKFQVIQSYLAEIAAECAAASAILASAVADDGRSSADRAIGAAKVRAGMMAGKVTAIAHQIHGAMGFTREYPLHLSTRRLWAWRDEFGDETYWAQRIGRNAVAAGGDRTWEELTA